MFFIFLLQLSYIFIKEINGIFIFTKHKNPKQPLTIINQIFILAGEKMEKQTNTTSKINESLTLVNREKLTLEGIVEVISSSDTQLNIKLKDTLLVIQGQNLNIAKLDICSGFLDINGLITSIKYGKSGNIFKRIFQ